jgi:hypothetical protein
MMHGLIGYSIYLTNTDASVTFLMETTLSCADQVGTTAADTDGTDALAVDE